MKTISVLVAVLTLAFVEVAAASAVATSITGNTTVQAGSAEARPLRTGDRVNQGDTVVTGAASSAVLKFDDGQVVAMPANSRVTVTNYSYRPADKKGSVLISLVRGGMRFITGLIGKNSPESVGIRAATATIGIRGTDITCVTVTDVIFCQVDEGSISLTYNGQTVVINTGNAALTQPNGTISQGTITQIHAALQSTPVGAAISQALGGLTGLSNAINQAFPGTPTQGQGGPTDTSPGTGTGTGLGSPTGPGMGGGGGGGRPGSPS